MWYSLQSTFFVCLLIGGQVGLVILGLGVNLALISLLLGLLATGILLVIFTPYLAYSQAAFAVERSERYVDSEIDFTTLSEADFTRYTRRALSYLDDLPKLALPQKNPSARLSGA